MYGKILIFTRYRLKMFSKHILSDTYYIIYSDILQNTNQKHEKSMVFSKKRLI